MRTTTIAAVSAGAAAGFVLANALLTGPTAIAANPEATPMNAADTATDRERILDHIHTIFQAYIDKDRATIRDTHTKDWRGFTVGAASLMRGIDAYMANADGTLANTTPLRYEILDTDVKVSGDMGIVYYLASYTFQAGGEERTVHLRSVDVYERRDGHWIQSGSNICTPPADVAEALARPRTMSDDERAELLRVRERVWRAWFANDEPALRQFLPAETLGFDAGPYPCTHLPEILANSKAFAATGATLTRLEYPKTDIQAFGPVAILYTSYVFDVTDADNTTSTTTGRATEVFVKRNGHWLNPGWHLDTGS
jgi:ketosteroid isomerase-like protein